VAPMTRIVVAILLLVTACASNAVEGDLDASATHIISEIRILDFKDLQKTKSLVGELKDAVNIASSAEHKAMLYVYDSRVKAYYGDKEQSILLLSKSVAYANQIKSIDSKLDYLQSKAIIYARLGEFLSALQVAKDIVDLGEGSNSDYHSARAFGLLGVLYLEIGLTDLSEESYNQALKRFIELGDDRAQARVILNKVAGRLRGVKRYSPEENLTMLATVEKLSQGGANERIFGHVYYMKGFSYRELSMHQAALENLYKAADLGQRQSAIHLIAQVYIELSKTYYDMADFDSALSYGKEALELSRTAKHSQLQQLALVQLSHVYNAINEVTQAYAALKKAKELEMKSEKSKIYELTTSIEKSLAIQREELKIQELESEFLSQIRKHQLQISISIGGLLILIFLSVAFYQKSKISKLKLVQSMRDQLTGAFLRSYLTEQVEIIDDRLSHSESEPGLSIAIILIDCDNFKPVNDNLGHSAGDYSLSELVKVVDTVIRPSDLLVRWGGDEFAVVCESISYDDLEKLSERIRLRIETHRFVFDGHILPITCSIGFAMQEEQHKFLLQDLLDCADKYLYQSKENGRNTVTGGIMKKSFSPSM